MRRWLLLCALAACGDDGGGGDTPGSLAFEPYSPPIPSSTEKPIAARGDVILTEFHLTRDGGATWRGLNPQAGAMLGGTVLSSTEIVVRTTTCALCRWNLDSDAVVDQHPPNGGGITLARPSTGTVLVTNGTVLSRQTAAGAAWSTITLPSPGGTLPMFGITDLAQNDTTIVLASTWGIYRSTDDGASFQIVFQPAMNAGAYLTALGDGRFALHDVYHINGMLLDATGANTGTSLGRLPNNSDPVIGCMGAMIQRYSYSSDLGMTWKSIAPSELQPTDVACGGDYVVTRTGTWLVTSKTLGAAEHAIGSWEGPAAAGGHGVVTGDGTVLNGGLVWHPGDTTWSIEATYDLALYPLDDGTVLGYSPTEVLRSDEHGTWTRMPVTTPRPDRIKRFFLDGGVLRWASGQGGQMVGGALFTDGYLYRTDDNGASWTQVWVMTRTQDVMMNVTGQGPFLIGIETNGDFVANGYISHDKGTTWTEIPNWWGSPTVALTNRDNAIVWTDGTATNKVWKVYGAGRTGELRGTVTPTLDGMAISAPADFQLDAQDHVYFTTGSPARLMRSVKTID